MLGGVRVRVIELRILGAALVGLWLVTGGLILFGYRPGGPIDVAVGLAAAGPALVALVAVAWPPVAHGDRSFAAIAWFGLGAMLLLVPSIADLVAQLEGRGPQTLLPSLEAAYPWGLALIATGLYAGQGVARRRLGETATRRRRMVVGVIAAIAMVLAAGSAFATAAVVNELALGNRPAISSRFGPTDPAQEPPPCNGVLDAGPSAVLALSMDASVDGTTTGEVGIAGVRSGLDIRWTGFAATRFTLGQQGFVRIGGNAWELAPGSPWLPSSTDRTSGRDLDRLLVQWALTPAIRVVAEDRGLSFIEGARARHCRVALDGETLRLALPQVNLLVGRTDLSRWRGDLDFWVFADFQLGQADGRVTGPAIGLADDAVLATVRFRLTAIDRGRPVVVQPPAN